MEARPVPTLADVQAAAARIAGRVVRTPVLSVPALDAVAGTALLLKCENLQLGGAFKARGATHAVGRLEPAARARGVVTYSSGNHGLAVALAARSYDSSAHVTMPVDAPAVKVAAVRRAGAAVTFAGRTSRDRHEAALVIADRTGATVVPPFDDPDVIAGQGTATLELVAQAAERGVALDALLVPVGGGGLLAGACLVAREHGVRVFAVEPHGCNRLAQSLARGERVAVTPGPTLADGLRPTQLGALNFAIARDTVAGCFTVEDDELARALALLLVEAKVLVEPSGAAALGVALRGSLPGRPAHVGVILSGGNVGREALAAMLGRRDPR
jgi:threonine dehydratase